MRLHEWMYTNREGYPRLGVVVEIWFYTACKLATWDGRLWHVDGEGVAGPEHVLNWRPA